MKIDIILDPKLVDKVRYKEDLKEAKEIMEIRNEEFSKLEIPRQT